MSKNLKLEFVTATDIDKLNNQFPASIRVDERGFYLSLKACTLWGFKEGMYFHLVRGKGERNVTNGWYMVVNDTATDGAKLCNANHGAMMVLNRPLARLFVKEVVCNFGDTYYLNDTLSTHNDYKVIEVLTIRAISRTKRGKGIK